MKKRAYDVFISHASEDKEEFVTPLATELRNRGVDVWFDKFELRAGDSLRESIERGLATSRFGIVVYSPSFFKKRWPKKEVNGLFSREMSGRKKRILPVLHKATISELRKLYPIQADRYTLSSETPLSELCDELLRDIKPELLEVAELQARSFAASDAFIAAARAKHPAYDFVISNGPIGSLGSVPCKRVEVKLKDPNASPPSMNISFVGKGVQKAAEFIETGKSQIWEAGEIAKFHFDHPLFSPDLKEGFIFTVSTIPDPKPRPVRVEFKSRSQSAVFDLMYLERVRAGSREGQLRIHSEHEALSFTITSKFDDPSNIDMTFEWKILGSSARRCLRVVQMIDAMSEGSELIITDLTKEFPVIRLSAASAKDQARGIDAFSRKLIGLCAQIEDRFNKTIPINKDLNPTDEENLEILDCLLNEKDFPRRIAGKVDIEKGKSAAVDDQISSMAELEVKVYSPAGNYPGYFEIFGTRIEAPDWGLTARCEMELSREDREKFRDSKPGYTITPVVRSVGAAKLIWQQE